MWSDSELGFPNRFDAQLEAWRYNDTKAVVILTAFVSPYSVLKGLLHSAEHADTKAVRITTALVSLYLEAFCNKLGAAYCMFPNHVCHCIAGSHIIAAHAFVMATAALFQPPGFFLSRAVQ